MARSIRSTHNTETLSFETTRRNSAQIAKLSTEHPPVLLATKKPRFRSQRLVGQYDQPWLNDKRLHPRRGNHIFLGWVVLGFAISGYMWYSAIKSVGNHEYCLILDDSFATLDDSIWTHEVSLGDDTTGSFQWATTSPSNSYTSVSGLHIIPTLTNMTTSITGYQISQGYTLNLTADKSCTSTQSSACIASSNTSSSKIINPVRSARLTTKGKKNLLYGRVEVTMKVPKGDWLWARVKLLPEGEEYGEWPRSGEIGVAQVRGNGVLYEDGGRDTMTSLLHWGPSNITDSYWRTVNGRSIRRTDFTEEFNVFGVEWSQNYIYTYINSRLVQVLFVGTSKRSFWDLGAFASMTELNQSLFTNPWSASGDINAPFNQKFYLALDVAVGSTNGWFRDDVGRKPWVDESLTAMTDFWRAVGDWLPTWGAGEDSGMTVRNVKMWQQGKCEV